MSDDSKTGQLTVTDTAQLIPLPDKTYSSGGANILLSHENKANAFYVGLSENMNTTSGDANAGQSVPTTSAWTSGQLSSGDRVYVMCAAGLSTIISYTATGVKNA
jgi:hypothetical protein